MHAAGRALAALALCASALVGCKSNPARIVIGPETLTQIEPGTNRRFVVALLGEPAERIALDDGVELWKWGYHEKRTSGGGVVYVIDATPRAETEHGAYVELKNGLVTKAWRD